MTTSDRRAGLGWPSDVGSDAAPGNASDPSTPAGLGWPVEAAPAGSPSHDDANHDEEHA